MDIYGGTTGSLGHGAGIGMGPMTMVTDGRGKKTNVYVNKTSGNDFDIMKIIEMLLDFLLKRNDQEAKNSIALEKTKNAAALEETKNTLHGMSDETRQNGQTNPRRAAQILNPVRSPETETKAGQIANEFLSNKGVKALFSRHAGLSAHVEGIIANPNVTNEFIALGENQNAMAGLKRLMNNEAFINEFENKNFALAIENVFHNPKALVGLTTLLSNPEVVKHIIEQAESRDLQDLGKDPDELLTMLADPKLTQELIDSQLSGWSFTQGFSMSWDTYNAENPQSVIVTDLTRNVETRAGISEILSHDTIASTNMQELLQDSDFKEAFNESPEFKDLINSTLSDPQGVKNLELILSNKDATEGFNDLFTDGHFLKALKDKHFKQEFMDILRDPNTGTNFTTLLADGTVVQNIINLDGNTKCIAPQPAGSLRAILSNAQTTDTLINDKLSGWTAAGRGYFSWLPGESKIQNDVLKLAQEANALNSTTQEKSNIAGPLQSLATPAAEPEPEAISSTLESGGLTPPT